MGMQFGHKHYSQRNPNLRAAVLGANDGIVTVAALMLGVGSSDEVEQSSVILAGIAALVAGSLSMALGEYVSVSSQRDTELADLRKERKEHMMGPLHRACELQQLAKVYQERGLSEETARMVAEELTVGKDLDQVVSIHVREELGIDVNDLANPLKAMLFSALCFALGGLIPLMAGSFLHKFAARTISVVVVSAVALAISGTGGAMVGGARPWLGALRVMIGGLIAMGATYGVGRFFSSVLGVQAPVA
eukprot:NODE_1123_length_993_cov_94.055085_g932_i0.p1 GENE.NODE_1123_length_993_cov_94.055085_g932_i0~~NODE_1123_length_993_cov_94.055085_g932_i0.p1  ORF type:complete len:248 (-),score=63.93 NODE_1123_length_993_cov_94.055085_g932_i0:217-960(-)